MRGIKNVRSIFRGSPVLGGMCTLVLVCTNKSGGGEALQIPTNLLPRKTNLLYSSRFTWVGLIVFNFEKVLSTCVHSKLTREPKFFFVFSSYSYMKKKEDK